MPKDEYEGPNRDEAQKPEDVKPEPPSVSVTPNPADTDYEALFMKDAQRRAHDAELSALASLALIRSHRDENGVMLMKMERDLSLSPRMVDRHLREDGGNNTTKK